MVYKICYVCPCSVLYVPELQFLHVVWPALHLVCSSMPCLLCLRFDACWALVCVFHMMGITRMFLSLFCIVRPRIASFARCLACFILVCAGIAWVTTGFCTTYYYDDVPGEHLLYNCYSDITHHI